LSSAIFGGTFDPVHNGHIKMVHSAMEQFNLDRMIVVPNATPPHKKNEVSTDFNHRYNMLKLAFDGTAKVEISDYESGDNIYHYSLNTMRYFRRVFGEDTYFVLGADSLCTVHRWYESETFLKENRFIVFLRQDDEKLMKTFESYKKQGIELYLSDMPFFDASSTEVRTCLYEGIIPTDALKDEVVEYIREHGLYGGRI